MSWNQEHLDFFKQCFNQPPQQGPVGQPPASYLRILRACQNQEIQIPQDWDQKFSRTEIRGICQDPTIDVLDAYAAVMAWGGQHRKWFRASIATPPLHDLLEALRASQSSREEDFARAQNASRAIPGLGISFYTKLLYFFRPESNAYILDQWTAKSMVLLANGIVPLANWGGPDPLTTREQYEAFCAKLDSLAENRGWTCRAQAEEAIFDKRNGRWRAHVKRHTAQSTNIRTHATQDEIANHLFPMLEDATAQAVEQSTPLPTGNVYRLPDFLAFDLPNRAQICWDYKIIGGGGVRCLLRFLGVCVGNQCEPIWNAYERTLPNGGINMLGRNLREIYIDVQRNGDEMDDEFADRVVQEMSRFCVCIYELALEANCNHPNLIPCNLPQQ